VRNRYRIASLLKMKAKWQMDLNVDEVDLGFVVNLEEVYFLVLLSCKGPLGRLVAFSSNGIGVSLTASLALADHMVTTGDVEFCTNRRTVARPIGANLAGGA
jgi:hypothetical protein